MNQLLHKLSLWTTVFYNLYTTSIGNYLQCFYAVHSATKRASGLKKMLLRQPQSSFLVDLAQLISFISTMARVSEQFLNGTSAQ